MTFHLLCVGKLSLPFIRDGVAEYSRRLERYGQLRTLEVKEEKSRPRGEDSRLIRAAEGQRLLTQLPASACAIALDEQGQQLCSEELAQLLQQRMLHGCSALHFLIGGAYGLSDAVRQRADQVLSLSRLTWTHQMARLLLLEQLYRAMTIIRNEPYHNR
ncbi:MAG: 23S rRNA (pseudouridine(1915)-N(3))-methyltransferase RlmH [Desulfuromonas thiophila]|nr:23S rRNA (pseudouridine(1915)-N(3))-methyltransferase RlmH [Desulfuromonas thiophila]MDD3800932.1 23S rRNA (pseudouridine(1915)-N(3))-methyltransferase RlmH [Desulfuromonas thiophila]MDY0397034.1 23S rRNA (pseudouridine(1915)-N(3))-methyltransferase RlmH [Desulfuromonas thiophila]